MRRRDFLAGLSAVVSGWPLPAVGERSAMPMVGFLSSRSPGESAKLLDAFLEGLHATGHIEGSNVQIAYRWAGRVEERLPPRASELVGKDVAVIVAAGDLVSPLAAKAATSSIPIVFTGIDDPVGSGLVADLDRPGRNVTGMSLFDNTLGPARLELLRALRPQPRRIALLVNPKAPQAQSYLHSVTAAANGAGQDIVVVEASTDDDLDTAFASLVARQASALLVHAEPFFNSRAGHLVALAARHRMPAIYGLRDHAAMGGLVNYGPSVADSYRQAGIYTGRILNGEKPADLPVRQPTTFELVINLSTARALGIAVPDAFMARADNVLDETVLPRPSPEQTDRENPFWPP